MACRLNLCFCSILCLFKYISEFLQFLVCFSFHLQVILAPGPLVVKPARHFATCRARKVQGLSNQCPHFELFSISTGRNKPPGEINQSPRLRQPPQPPVTHTVYGPGCRCLVRPHTSWPRSLKNQLHNQFHGHPAPTA